MRHGRNLPPKEISNLINKTVLEISNRVYSNSLIVANKMKNDAESNMSNYINGGLIKDTNTYEQAKQAFEKDRLEYESTGNTKSTNRTATKRLNSGSTRVDANRAADWVRNHGKSGDIVWCEYESPLGVNGVFLSGHTGQVCKDPDTGDKMIYSILGNKNELNSVRPGWHYPIESHVSREWHVKAGKLLKVVDNSGRDQTAAEGQRRIEIVHNDYFKNKVGYGIPWRKKDISGGVYCSQINWWAWHEANYKNHSDDWFVDRIDIDGSPFPQGKGFYEMQKSWKKVTLHIGWFTIQCYVLIITAIWVVVTIDMVQPWDIVIDNNTRELGWWGEYHDLHQ